MPPRCRGRGRAWAPEERLPPSVPETGQAGRQLTAVLGARGEAVVASAWWLTILCRVEGVQVQMTPCSDRSNVSPVTHS